MGYVRFPSVLAHWGYLPGTIKTREEAQAFIRLYTTMNFKSENMFLNEKGNKSMWADAVEKGRTCLVLSTGMVENRHIQKIGKKGEPLKATDAYPYMVTMKYYEYWWLPGLDNQVLGR